MLARTEKSSGDALIDEIVANINAARRIERPFYHLDFDRVFPDDVYAAMLELIAKLLVDYREQDDSRLALDLAKDTLELLGRAYQRIDVLDRLVVGIMCHRRARNRVECLTGCIGNQVHMKKTAHPRKVAIL